jgi:hypothetical protein
LALTAERLRISGSEGTKNTKLEGGKEATKAVQDYVRQALEVWCDRSTIAPRFGNGGLARNRGGS